MKKLTNFFLLFLTLYAIPIFSTSPPKIYDCFLFFNELQVLEIRLEELYDAVDYFVLVESAETFRGKPKPYYFDENRDYFEKFLDKIIHIKVDEHFPTRDPWQREFYQRNQIIRGLKNCGPKDIVLISDVDEVYRANALPLMVSALTDKNEPAVTVKGPMYYYYLNRPLIEDGNYNWTGAVATTFKTLLTTTPQMLRKRRYIYRGLENSAWHFCYLGGIDAIIYKTYSFSHVYNHRFAHNGSPYVNPKEVAEKMEEGPFIEIDETYPQFVRDNKKILEERGFIKVME